LHLKLDY